MRKLFVFLFLVSLMLSCRVNERINKINFNYLYKQTIADNAPKYVLYFANDSTCRVYYKIPPGALMYKKDEDSEQYIANYSLSFKIFESYKAKNLLDSVNLNLTDTNILQQPKTIIDSIDLKKPDIEKGVLKINFHDANKQITIEDFIIMNTKKYSRYYFCVMDSSGEISFNNYKYDGAFYLKTYLDVKSLNINCYHRDFPIAKPPFADNQIKPFNYQPDNVKSVNFKDGKTEAIRLDDAGFYHFQTDTSNREGIAIFKFHEGFPLLTSTEQLLMPLRYITTSKEFQAIENSENLKKGIDEFWLTLAGNPVRAKAMIQEYYSRFEEANMLFTSYTEGWRTDRGMIYIIFGMPKAVFKDVEIEEWIYGETFHPKAINFYFMKVINPFTDDDYYLQRSSSYKDPWYMAVDRIRR